MMQDKWQKGVCLRCGAKKKKNKEVLCSECRIYIDKHEKYINGLINQHGLPANNDSIINCQICEKEIRFGECFGYRCPECEQIGYKIWGFGENAEHERDKKVSFQDQRTAVLDFKKILDNVANI